MLLSGKLGAAGVALTTQIFSDIPQYPNFSFSSIQLNKNYKSALHVDGYNLGPSLIVGVGDYEDGKLWVQDKGAVDCKHPHWQEFLPTMRAQRRLVDPYRKRPPGGLVSVRVFRPHSRRQLPTLHARVQGRAIYSGILYAELLPAAAVRGQNALGAGP